MMIIRVVLFFGLGLALICPGAFEKKFSKSWDRFEQIRDTETIVVGTISNIFLYFIKWFILIGLLCEATYVFTLESDDGYLPLVCGIGGYILIYAVCYKVTAIFDRSCFFTEKGMWIYDLTKPMIKYQDVELIQLRKTLNPANDQKGHLVIKFRYDGRVYKFVVEKIEVDDEDYEECKLHYRQSEEEINKVLEWIEPMANKKLEFEADIFASILGKGLIVGGICIALIGGAVLAAIGVYPFLSIAIGIICSIIGAFLYKKERLK